MSDFKEDNKELYGLLMSVNERVTNVGSNLIWILGVAVFALCVTIHMRWVDTIFGIPIDRVRGFSVYILMFLVAFVIITLFSQIRENMVYQAAKPYILRKMQESGLSAETLIAEISEDQDLKEIREKIMGDKNFCSTD